MNIKLLRITSYLYGFFGGFLLADHPALGIFLISTGLLFFSVYLRELQASTRSI